MRTHHSPLHVILLACLPSMLAAQQAAQPDSPSPDSQPFLSEKKVAVVVGISEYPKASGFPKLKYAAKDAKDLASSLEKQGYKTQLLMDQDAMKNGIRDALQTVQDQISQDRKDDKLKGTILFAFSGHGGQINSKQYLATFDADARRGDYGISMDEIEQALTSSGAARKMMFIDACRIVAESSSKDVSPLSSFSELRQAKGIKTFYSAAPGAKSYEDDDAHNGKFTHYLLEALSGRAATPDGLVTFDNLAKWVIRNMGADAQAYQVPYWNQEASGDFYIAGQAVRRAALVVGIDNYGEQTLHSAIGGARKVEEQFEKNGFDAALIENARFAEMESRINAFAKDLSPKDVAVFYFAGEGGIASGKPFLMAADGRLPSQAVGGKWEKPPEHSITLADVMDKVRQNHPGPNIFLLDMGMMRASNADTLDLAALRREHTLVLFSGKPGQDAERNEEGSLFSRTFVKVLQEPRMSATNAAARIMSAVFDQSNGVQYVIEIPMLPDRVFLTPSQ